MLRARRLHGRSHRPRRRVPRRLHPPTAARRGARPPCRARAAAAWRECRTAVGCRQSGRRSPQHGRPPAGRRSPDDRGPVQGPLPLLRRGSGLALPRRWRAASSPESQDRFLPATSRRSGKVPSRASRSASRPPGTTAPGRRRPPSPRRRRCPPPASRGSRPRPPTRSPELSGRGRRPARYAACGREPCRRRCDRLARSRRRAAPRSPRGAPSGTSRRQGARRSRHHRQPRSSASGACRVGRGASVRGTPAATPRCSAPARRTGTPRARRRILP